MNAKEKAKELCSKFNLLVTTWDCYNDTPIHDEDILEDTKKCALVVVNQILEDCIRDIAHLNYWVSVKDEIGKLKIERLVV